MGLDGVANGTNLYAGGIEAASRLDRGRPRWASMGVASPQIHRSGPSSSPFGPEEKFKHHSHLSESERCGLVLKLCWLFAQANILATWRKWRTKILEGRMLGNSGRPSRFWEAIEALSDPFIVL